MNPVKKAIVELKYRIPLELLERVFVDGSRLGRQNWRSNIDEQILALVVRPRVLVDCNLIGGSEQLINLSGLAVEVPCDFPWATIIHIPKSRTFNKTINSVLNVNFFATSALAGYLGSSLYSGTTMGSNFNPTSSDNSAMMAATATVMAAMDKIPCTSTSRVELIAENTIMLREGMALNTQCYLRCILANDEDLSGLQLKNYRHFSELVEFAVKSFIYNTLKIQVDIGELRFGQNIGAFKEVLESYADAEANYRDYLVNKMQKVLFMNDDTSYSRLIGMLCGTMR